MSHWKSVGGGSASLSLFTHHESLEECMRWVCIAVALYPPYEDSITASQQPLLVQILAERLHAAVEQPGHRPG
jgi:hypothetical protein